MKAAYSVNEAADLYSVSRDTIFKAIHSGRLEYRKVGRKYLVGADALAKWFASEDA